MVFGGANELKDVTGYGGTARFVDNGNLIMSGSDGSMAWQSFNFLTDTLMRVGWI